MESALESSSRRVLRHLRSFWEESLVRSFLHLLPLSLVLPSPPLFFLSPNLTSTTSSHGVHPTVLLQYLSSVNILKVNWSRASSVYEKLTSTPSDVPGGKSVGLTVTKLWGWVVDFLTR